MSDSISRINDKIRILKEILQRGEFIIISEGDPDLPEGLKFKMPKAWEKQINKAIEKLKKKLKDEIDKV